MKILGALGGFEEMLSINNTRCCRPYPVGDIYGVHRHVDGQW